MDGSNAIDATAPKLSGLPRPTVSKLPLARSSTQQSSIPAPSAAPPALPKADTVISTAVQRQPLGAPRRPQSKQEPVRHYAAADNLDGISRAKALRNPSQQENALQLVDSSEESESSSSTRGQISPVKTPRRFRPSLADRTVESILNVQVPQSPASTRRHSTFFNPQSPMTPMRPTSANEARQSTIPRANTGAVRQNTIPRPTSPSKIPGSAAALRGGNGAATPRSGLPAPASQRSPQKLYNPRHSTIVPSSSAPTTKTAPAGHARSMSMLARPTPTSQRPTTNNTRPQQSQGRALQRPKTMAPPPRSVLASAEKADESAPEAVTSNDSKPSSSSATLRAQIAQAKLAHRNTSQKGQSLSSQGSDVTSSYSFEECDDPFNQVSKAEQDPLSKRMIQGLRDGKLDIGGMSLKKIPDEVLKMYDAEFMEKSGLMWSETVDLSKLNTAENEIEELTDEAFPDISKESMFQDVDAKGSLFRGLEMLDARGNSLKTLPIGLRRLERLSVLNLARNKLDNSVFSIVTQIHTLKSLDLSANELTRDLPDSISLLFSLETLSLKSNKLSMLPSSLRELTSLRTLDLSSNRLSSLPIECLAALPMLQELSAAHNAMTGALFHGEITGFSKLTHLSISDNALASITFSPQPPNLPQLKHLDVSRNRMAIIPNMAGWTALTTFLAADNMLMALPEGFTSLTKELRRVDMAGNGIRNIEDGIAQMERLEWLSMQGNPLIQKKYLTMSTEDMKKDLARKGELDAALG